MAVQFQAPGLSVIGLIGVDLNNANTDFPLDISYLKYVARRVTACGPSVSLGSSPATLGLFTLPNGGGTAVIPLTGLTALNGVTKFADVPLTFTNYATLSRVYFRVGTPHGSPATIDVYIEITPLI